MIVVLMICEVLLTFCFSATKRAKKSKKKAAAAGGAAPAKGDEKMEE